MHSIDLNCDMGEGTGQDFLIMPYISSANIACGYHAGDEKTMWETIELASRYNVAIGAHVSFRDRENFGRHQMVLPAQEVYELVVQQLIIINEIAEYFELPLQHVKPHGALYNMAATDPVLARAIAEAIRDYNDQLILFGLSGSQLVSEGTAMGLQTASEVFADRSYQDDGTLTPRTKTGALLEDADAVVRQAMQMIKQGTVTAVSGMTIPIIAETLCIHGDGLHAAVFAKRIHEALTEEGIRLAPPGVAME